MTIDGLAAFAVSLPDGIMLVDDLILRLSEREVFVDDCPLGAGLWFCFW
jgi:hypothetical protein